MHHLSFWNKQQGFSYDAYCMCVCQKVFTLKDHLGAFWQTWDEHSFFFPVSGVFCVGALPWISFFSCFFSMVDSWRLTEAKDKRSLRTPGCWNSFLFLTSCLIFIFCSWRDFGRTMTSWKIHYCPRVSPLARYVVGWDSLESWSFWNDFGRISRLTGVDIIPLEILKDCVWSWCDMVHKPVCWWLFSHGVGQIIFSTVRPLNQMG